ncbi:sulfite exporter TauE/SafE family protein [Sphingorhabdus sp. M41]|uniref:sulfite exporter TauE/SafE family protein n=1 Tax=Sphingorhabdus sp. M41 TaxID=1806885 RepID=UPI002FF69EFF
MADIIALLPYLLIGFLAQAVDGALGMAFGVIVNSILVGFMGMSPALASTHVHVVKCFTSAASGISHHLVGNIDFQLFRRLLFPGLLGGILGAFLLSYVQGRIVHSFVLGYLLLTGLWLLIKSLWSSPEIRRPRFVSIVGGLGGFLDAIGGGGWGPVVTSNLLVQGAEPRKVVGTVNSVEFFITVMISTIFIAHFGFENFVGPVVSLLIGGIIAAPLGAIAAKYFQPRLMFFLVGIVLTSISAFAILQMIL